MRIETVQRLYDALKRISSYDNPERLRKRAERDYGLDAHEAIEMAYDNVLNEARVAIKGLKRPALSQSRTKGTGNGKNQTT